MRYESGNYMNSEEANSFQQPEMVIGSRFSIENPENGVKAVWDFMVPKPLELGVDIEAIQREPALQSLNDSGVIALEAEDSQEVTYSAGRPSKLVKLLPLAAGLGIISAACGGARGEDIEPTNTILPELPTVTARPEATNTSRVPNTNTAEVPTAPPPTETPTELPTATNTAEPTATNTVEPTVEMPKLGNGEYNSIDEMPISEEEKAAIKEMTKDSEIQFISRHGIVAIHGSLSEREMAPSPATLVDVPAPKLTSIELVSPEAAQKEEERVMLVKYQQYRQSSGRVDVSFEDYKAGSEEYDTTVWAYNNVVDPAQVATYEAQKESLQKMEISGDSVRVLILVGRPESLFVSISTEMRVGDTVIPVNDGANVWGIWGYAFDPAAIGHPEHSKFTLAGKMNLWEAVITNPGIEVAGSRYGVYNPNTDGNVMKDEIFPVMESLTEINITMLPDNKAESLYKATGTAADLPK